MSGGSSLQIFSHEWNFFYIGNTFRGFNNNTVSGLFQYTKRFCLKVGVNLLVCSCFGNTLSPSFTSLSRAPRFSSAYRFPHSLAFLSLSRTFQLSTWNSSIPGIRVLNFLRKMSSAGLSPVVLCGVVLCMTRKDSISFLQSFFSICTILIPLSRDRFYLSTTPSLTCPYNTQSFSFSLWITSFDVC